MTFTEIFQCYMQVRVNPYSAEVIYLNFQAIEVVSRCRDPQPQVLENYSYVFILRPNIYKFCCLNRHFIPNNHDSSGVIGQ